MERSLFSILFDFDDQDSTPFNPFDVATPADTTSTDTTPAPDDLAPTTSTHTVNTPAPAVSPSQPPPASEQSPVQEPQQGEPGRMLVCAGAMCVCDKAASPNPVKLQVLSHQKFFVNDADGTEKFLATTKEKDILALNFNQCKVPDPSKPVPCSAQLEWQDFYEGVELPGGAYVLTEKSTAVCTAKGGKITIKTHGQQMAINTGHLEQACTSNWNAVNPMIKEEDVHILQHDQDMNNEPGAPIEKIAVITTAPAAEGTVKIYPVNNQVEFQVKKYKNNYQPTPAEKQAIDWVVYDQRATPIRMESDIGPAMSTIFRKAGEYIIEAYGKAPGKKAKLASAQGPASSCRIRIEENGLRAVKISGNKTLVRVDDGLTFTADLLFSEELAPLPGQPISQTSWKVGKVNAHENLKANSLTVLEYTQGQVLKGPT